MELLEQIKQTAMIRIFALLKIPLLAWVHPFLVENTKETTILRIPLSRRTKNHLGSMYFGALVMGAEASIAIKAIQTIRESGQKVDFIFKDFSCVFHKRAEGDVHFVCNQGFAIKNLVEQCLKSGERESQIFESFAVVPQKHLEEKVAEFKITLSVKKRNPRP